MRSLTKADDERGVKLIELGCIICHNVLGVFSPPAIHHLDGKTKKGCHKLTIPLCGNHHQIKSNVGEWASRHGDGLWEFENRYGSELEMLDDVNRLINE